MAYFCKKIVEGTKEGGWEEGEKGKRKKEKRENLYIKEKLRSENYLGSDHIKIIND